MSEIIITPLYTLAGTGAIYAQSEWVKTRDLLPDWFNEWLQDHADTAPAHHGLEDDPDIPEDAVCLGPDEEYMFRAILAGNKEEALFRLAQRGWIVCAECGELASDDSEDTFGMYGRDGAPYNWHERCAPEGILNMPGDGYFFFASPSPEGKYELWYTGWDQGRYFSRIMCDTREALQAHIDAKNITAVGD